MQRTAKQRRLRPKKQGRLRRSNRPLLIRQRRRLAQPRRPAAYRLGYQWGLEDGKAVSIDQETYQKKALNRHWNARLRTHAAASGPPWSGYMSSMRGYLDGFFRAKRMRPPNWVLMPSEKSLAVIVTAMNEGKRIGGVLDQLNRLPADELFVIVNGSTDATFQQARIRSHAVVVHYPEALGHDVGRAIGAKLAVSELLLFVDADMPITAEQLIPFIGGLNNGLDVVLNHIDPYVGSFRSQDAVTRMKRFLNEALGRPDLGAASLTAVPHGLSRKAIETIGAKLLSVPPKAQAAALLSGLCAGAPGSVNVIRLNQRRANNQGKHNRMEQLIIGDHLEALSYAAHAQGERLQFVDTIRRRSEAEVK